MHSFPDTLTPTSIKENKQELITARETAYTRRYIYESLLKTEFSIPDNCGINLQNIPMGETMEIKFSPAMSIIEQIRGELTNIGFDTTIGYGNTVLFVHTKEEQPSQSIKCVSFG